MHKYLRTIGFSKISTDRETRQLLDTLQDRCRGEARVVRTSSGDSFWEIRAVMGKELGLVMSGYVDTDGKLVRDHYMPYIEEQDISSDVYCSIERHVDNEVYSGLLDDVRVGITLIFRLNNTGEYLERRQRGLSTNTRGVQLTGFCRNGKILLPIVKNVQQAALSKVADKAREQMIEAARNGDKNAMETLANEDMNMYNVISRRMMREDIYSIVDSCFMPQGIECDIYEIIGDILEISMRKNLLTGENLWDFLVKTNDLPIHVCINEADLQGEPKVGRRFKGTIWLQGSAVWEN